jgi:glycosyltransferase involved in cell wall biosynthesis
MRIAWITTGFSKDESDYGGAAAIHNLARELSKEIELVVFSLYYPLNQSTYNFHNAKVYSFALEKFESRAVKLKIWRNCEKEFAAEHNRKKFDIIHSMWAGESGHIAAKLSKKFEIPLIVNICGGELAGIKEIEYGSRLKYWQKRFVDRSFKQADKIVTGSEYITEKINTYYKKGIALKVINIPFGVDEKLFYPVNKKETTTDDPVLLSVGSVVPVKAHDILFNSLKMVKEKFPIFKLIHCGMDSKNLLGKMVADAGLKDNITLMGFVPYENMPKVINEADIFVSSSLYESQNMSLVEAAFCGLLLVSTDTGAARDITSNIVRTGDAASLANKIIEVIENLGQEKEKASAMIDKLKGRYSLGGSVKKYLELYSSPGL